MPPIVPACRIHRLPQGQDKVTLACRKKATKGTIFSSYSCPTCFIYMYVILIIQLVILLCPLYGWCYVARTVLVCSKTHNHKTSVRVYSLLGTHVHFSHDQGKYKLLCLTSLLDLVTKQSTKI